MSMHCRAMVWVRRYLPAELLSIAVTLICTTVALVLSHNQALAAVVGTWAEFLAYYGVIVAGDLRAQQQRSPGTVLATLRNIVLEFGLAELLDSTLIRPAALYAGMTLVPSLPLGIVAGKLVADLIFYLPTITSYELLRRQRAQA